MDVPNHEARIDSALGKILRSFNFLELNLGLCIRHMENPDHVDLSHNWLGRSTMQDKIERFVRLVRENGLVNEEAELDAWCESAIETRSARNYYVHGTWEYLPLAKEAPLSFKIPPWRSENGQWAHGLPQTLQDLEAHAEAVEAVFHQFQRLRRKYGV